MAELRQNKAPARYPGDILLPTFVTAMTLGNGIPYRSPMLDSPGGAYPPPVMYITWDTKTGAFLDYDVPFYVKQDGYRE